MAVAGIIIDAVPLVQNLSVVLHHDLELTFEDVIEFLPLMAGKMNRLFLFLSHVRSCYDKGLRSFFLEQMSDR